MGGLPRGFLRPARLDQDLLNNLVDVGLPRASVQVTVQALPQVAKMIATPFIAEGVRHPRRVGSAMTAFVVRHPEVTFLVDPGICTDVLKRAVSDIPLALRVVVKPPRDVIDVRTGLSQVGLAPADIDFAMPTHLHWDHVAGLLDFPDLPMRLHSAERAWAMTGERAPVGGVRSALRGRSTDEFELDGPPVLTFGRSHDLLGDGSVVLVDLTGHTPGSVGVLLNTESGPILLAGDAAWHTTQIEHVRHKASYPGLLVDEDRPATLTTLHRLHAVQDKVRIIPAHDPDAARAIR